MPTINPRKLVPGVTPDQHDLLVYYVDSRTPGEEPWRVDLFKFCANGECKCQQFCFRLLKYLVRRALPSLRLECYHIQQAKRYFTFECLNRIIENREREAAQNKAEAKARRVDRSVQEPARSIDATRSETQSAAFSAGQPTPFKKTLLPDAYHGKQAGGKSAESGEQADAGATGGTLSEWDENDNVPF